MKRWMGAMLLFAASAGAQQLKPGSTVGDFTLQDLKGKSLRYSTLKGDTTVVMFIATKCPISNSYNERMNALYKEYSAKGVKFVFVNSNQNEPASEVAEHAKTHGFAFPVYKDPNDAVANLFGAQVTPEAFVIDRTGSIRYHGYIDDSRNEERVQKRGLQMALDSVLAGSQVAAAETKAFGCTIKRSKR